MWKGQASIAKTKFLFIQVTTPIVKNAIIKLWEKSYNEKTQSGMVDIEGLDGFICP